MKLLQRLNKFFYWLAPVLMAMALCSLVGCKDDFERTTVKTLSADKAVIDQAAKDYNAAIIPQTQLSRQIISDARDAHNAAVQAFLAYYRVKESAHSSKDSIQNAQAATAEALAQLVPLIAKLQALYGDIEHGKQSRYVGRAPREDLRSS